MVKRQTLFNHTINYPAAIVSIAMKKYRYNWLGLIAEALDLISGSQGSNIWVEPWRVRNNLLGESTLENDLEVSMCEAP